MSRARTTDQPSAACAEAIMRVMNGAFDPTFGEAWNQRQVSDALVLPSTHALLIDGNGNALEEGGKDVVGFVLSRHAADEEELLLIAVLPQYRGQGLGHALIDRLLEEAAIRGVTRVFLEMRRGNPATHLYQKVGFEPIGERPNYYMMQDGTRIDAITFARSL
ncbi:MAG: GNAT family N-acetyltransferase [Pseudomonadota bacterium]